MVNAFAEITISEDTPGGRAPSIAIGRFGPMTQRVNVYMHGHGVRNRPHPTTTVRGSMCPFLKRSIADVRGRSQLITFIFGQFPE